MALLIVPLIGILGNVAGEILKYQHQHLGNSQATWLTITNYTNDELKIKVYSFLPSSSPALFPRLISIIQVSEVDNFDWDGHSRPDHGGGEGFQDAVIAPHSGIHKQENQELTSLYLPVFLSRLSSLSPLHSFSPPPSLL